ncbi:MAG: hypothetical protein PHS37_10310 [Candidatus Omnitrophica bacterium]|nr:hypothetical protein [Candidatus Omnitrophota bacterium]
MRKYIFTVLLIAGLVVPAYARMGFNGAQVFVPEVEYETPKRQEIVDLSGQTVLAFRWRPTPIPSGGRKCYKFTLYSAFSYDVIQKETLDPKTTSVEVPAGIFENGKTYTWEVKQRDDRTGNWDHPRRWSFTVKK